MIFVLLHSSGFSLQIAPLHHHSTVTERFGNGVLSKNSALLCFDLDLSSQNLWTTKYSDYQVFLYQTITDFREKGMNDVQIANWLNDNGYQTVRGSTFKNNHVHSIAKKRRRRLDILNTEPSLSISNMNVRYTKPSTNHSKEEE